MIREVTVHVPDERLTEFYTRFGDFMSGNISDRTADAANVMHEIGKAPAWVNEPGAKELAAKFWHDVTDPGRDLLRVLISGAEVQPARVFAPTELVTATNAKSTQSIAGIFGGVGQVISSAELPTYEYAPGKRWHFVWDWDPKKRLYSMNPEMAALLRSVGA
jgi:hypothetical protein